MAADALDTWLSCGPTCVDDADQNGECCPLEKSALLKVDLLICLPAGELPRGLPGILLPAGALALLPGGPLTLRVHTVMPPNASLTCRPTGTGDETGLATDATAENTDLAAFAREVREVSATGLGTEDGLRGN